jgi:hypothetical protein
MFSTIVILFSAVRLDALRDGVVTFRYHDRRGHRVFIVFERHRDVRRVGDDDVGFRPFLHIVSWRFWRNPLCLRGQWLPI